MSNHLYFNKAVRLITRADKLVNETIQNIIDNATPAASPELAQDIRAIFTTWQDRSKPIMRENITGQHMLIMPYSEIKTPSAGKKKKKAALYRAANIRIFIGDEYGQLSICRAGFTDNGAKGYDEVVSYFTKTFDDVIPPNFIPRHGRKIHNYQREEIEKIFQHRDMRYHDNKSPATYLYSRLVSLSKPHHVDISINHDILVEMTRDVETLWSEAGAYFALGMVNRDALRAVKLNHNANLREYQWIMDESDPQKIDRRIGAYASHPGLMPFFTNVDINIHDLTRAQRRQHTEHKTEYKRQQSLTTLIDEGESVPNALKQIFAAQTSADIPKKYLAPYHGKTDQHLDSYALKTLEKRLSMLAHFNRDEYPQSKNQWYNFEQHCQRLETAHKATHLPYTNIQQFYRANPKAKVEWHNISDFHAAINRSIFLPVIVQTAQKFGIGHDEILEFAQRLSGRHELFAPITADYTVPQILRASKDWHDRLDTITARLKSISVASDLSWPALLTERTTAQGVTIKPLTTKIELETEGDQMSHCVGGYASNCILDGSHIFHLSYTEKGETYHSTLQLKEQSQADKTTVEIRQNKAYRNKTPHQALQKTAEWLAKSINDGSLSVDWDSLKKRRKDIAAAYNKNRLINDIGFDPRDRAFCQQAFDIMKEFLPAQARQMDYDAFLQHTPYTAKLQAQLKSDLQINQGIKKLDLACRIG